jgi:hypothetical protein
MFLGKSVLWVLFLTNLQGGDQEERWIEDA